MSFMHFQFHEILPKLWKWQENRNMMRFHNFFCICINLFFLYSFVAIFFKFQELPVSTCTDIYFWCIFNFTRYFLVSLSGEITEDKNWMLFNSLVACSKVFVFLILGPISTIKDSYWRGFFLICEQNQFRLRAFFSIQEHLFFFTSSISRYLINIYIWQVFNFAIDDSAVKPYIPHKSLLQLICCKCLAW